MDLFAYSSELIDRHKVAPSDDFVGDLVLAGEDRASAMWIVGFVVTMVTGGNDTTTGLLGGAVEPLTRYPDQRQMMLADRSRIRPAIEEPLRLTSPVQNLARTTTRPVIVHDQEIPADRKVVLLYGAANRDEREFGPTAEEFEVDRRFARMLSFGDGAHHCLGAAAARLQAGVARERLLDRFPGFNVDAPAGRFAPGAFVRRYESLPMSPTGA